MPSHKSNVAPIKLPKDDIDQNKPNNLSNIVPIAKLIKNPVTFSITHFIKENKIIWRERKQGLDDIYAEYENLKKIYGTDYAQMNKEMK